MKKLLLVLALASSPALALDALDDEKLATENLPAQAGTAKPLQAASTTASPDTKTLTDVLNKEIPQSGNLRIEPAPAPVTLQMSWH